MPSAWVLNNVWLQAIANRVTFGFETMALSILILLTPAFAAVVSQTLRAALTDPVECLRLE